MSATAQSSLKQEIETKGSADRRPKTIGIIAGGGALPGRLIESCKAQGIDVFVVAFEGQTDLSHVQDCNYMLTRLGRAGQIINTLRAHNIQDLVLIGAIRRPAMKELQPDWRTFSFFVKIGFKALGDDGLLRTLRKELEREGFNIHGVHQFIPDLLAAETVYTTVRPKKSDRVNINRGIEVSQALGQMDVGQAVIVQEGIVLGIEAIEGTDELIRRTVALRRGGRGGVLVKTCKPKQDHDLDLPTVGPETVMKAAEAGLAGIVIDAGRTLVIDPQEMAELANESGIFIEGIDILNYQPQNSK